MPPRARSRPRSAAGPSALSEADISLLRERLEAGKKPRVVLLVDTALGAAGTSVPVVGFGEPAVGEFISIRLRDDVVPFSPAELGLPVRGRPTPVAAVSKPVSPAPTPPPAKPYVPSSAPAPAPAPAPAGSSGPRQGRLMAVPEPEVKTAAPAAEPAPPAKASGRRPARAGGLNVTIRFAAQNQTWTYESTRGGRRSAARPLNLAAVRAFADRIDDPALRKDLLGAIDVSRQQAQARADALRAELTRVEIELADLEE